MNFKSVAKFLFKKIIYKYKYFQYIIMNNKNENKKIIKALLKYYRIKKIDILIYYSQLNEFIEYDHDIIINLFFKYCKNDLAAWICYFSLILWINWISMRWMIEYSVFELFYKQNYILSIELSLISWNIINWKKEIESHENLLVIKIYQLNERVIKKI